MKKSNDIKTLPYDFGKTHEQGYLPAMQELERNVLGCDFGGTSWTTRSEANQIAKCLGLRPGIRLLEVGAGSGWPGLFLAHITGCDVFLVDIPFVGLQLAIERAKTEGLEQRCHGVVASGTALPFRDDFFDTLNHSDVLCCLPSKHSMLRECRRVARSGATMMFSVIAPATSLSDAQRQAAIESGPPFVDVDEDYAVLLHQSGWRVTERVDVTAKYARSVRAFLAGMEERAKALTEALGVDDFLELKDRRQGNIAAIDRGLLKREIFVALTI